jgi:mono/diheme cytochrome c family protein
MRRSLLFALVGVLGASSLQADRPRLEPKALYAQACAACHGADGKGSPTYEGEVPVPDFSDCMGNTAEPSELWETIVARGGASRGLSATMPAYGEALDPSEIRGLVEYLRAFCEGFERYPPGDLNFRRPLDTGKAYPEQEIVVQPEYIRFDDGEGSTGLEISYENRLGARFQYEAKLPLVLDGPGESGMGDVEIEIKQVLAFDLSKMQIFSAGLGVTLPTGDDDEGLGDGTAVFEPFVAFGKAWGRTILQTRLIGEIPTESDRRSSELAFQLALSRALGPPRIAWVPAVELLGSHNLDTGDDEWSSVIEVSKPLNALGHVIGALGVRLPLTESEEKYRIEAYLLWDFGDGPPWIGW